MDGYIIRKGEPVDWFTYEDGRTVDCEAGTDLWVRFVPGQGRQVQPLHPLCRGECIVIGKPDNARKGFASLGPETRIIGTPRFQPAAR